MAEIVEMDAITLSHRAELQKKINESRRDFLKMDSALMRTIPEYLFVQNFLPVFCGEVKLNVEDTRTLLSNWFTISGTNWGEVNVVDDKGKVVVTVPGICDSSVFKPIVDRETLTSYTIRLAQERMTIHHTLGERMIEEDLNKKVEKMTRGSTVDESRKAWNKVFAHYKKPLISSGEQAKDAVHVQEESEFEW